MTLLILKLLISALLVTWAAMVCFIRFSMKNIATFSNISWLSFAVPIFISSLVLILMWW